MLLPIHENIELDNILLLLNLKVYDYKFTTQQVNENFKKIILKWYLL